MATDADLKAAVNEVVKRIVAAESVRTAALDERGRGCSVGWAGQRFRLITPIGYEAMVEPLVQTFGDRLIVEFDDIRRSGERRS